MFVCEFVGYAFFVVLCDSPLLSPYCVRTMHMCEKPRAARARAQKLCVNKTQFAVSRIYDTRMLWHKIYCTLDE